MGNMEYWLIPMAEIAVGITIFQSMKHRKTPQISTKKANLTALTILIMPLLPIFMLFPSHDYVGSLPLRFILAVPIEACLGIGVFLDLRNQKKNRN